MAFSGAVLMVRAPAPESNAQANQWAPPDPHLPLPQHSLLVSYNGSRFRRELPQKQAHLQKIIGKLLSENKIGKDQRTIFVCTSCPRQCRELA